RSARRRVPVLPVLTWLFGLCLAVFAGFALFGDGRGGGEPAVLVALGEASRPDPTAVPAPVAAATVPEPAAAGGQRTVTIIDGSSGARKSITIPAADPDVVTPEAAQG